MDIIRRLEDLEDMLEIASTVPLTGKVMVDKEEMLQIIEDLKREIPQEVTKATALMEKQTTIIDEANLQAKQIVQAAHVEAEKILDEDDLVQQAQERSQGILQNAETESAEIRRSSREYVDNILEKTQVELSHIIEVLNDNRKELRD